MEGWLLYLPGEVTDEELELAELLQALAKFHGYEVTIVLDRDRAGLGIAAAGSIPSPEVTHDGGPDARAPGSP